MRERKKSKGVQSSWLDTYADMVTLLLCFFVMLFAMSTMDAAKWEMIVKSMNPEAAKMAEMAMNAEGRGKDAAASTPGAVDMEIKDFNDLYEQLNGYVKANGLENEIEVSKGEDFTFIVFRNNILFDGDSDMLKEGGRQVLDVLCTGIGQVNNQVGEMRVLGHTNQADPNRPNNSQSDRFLSSNRATRVLLYIQDKNIIEPKKLLSIGYGQHYPIASFVTESDRAKNRRVEILITKSQAASVTLEEVYQTIGKEKDTQNNNQ